MSSLYPNAHGDGASHPATVADRVPPYNLDAERQALGSALLAPENILDMANVLAPGDFYRDDHETLWGAILEVADSGEPVNTTSAFERLRRRNWSDEKSRELLEECCLSISHGASGVFLATVVHDKAQTRKLIEAATEILVEAYRAQDTSQALVSRAQEAIFQLGDAGPRASSDAVIADLTAQTMNVLDGRSNAPGGLSTGFSDLDDMIDGLQPERLYILAARPAQGKSALALNIADHVAMEGGEPVLFISLEMARVELAERFLSSRAKIGGYKLKNPKELSTWQRGELERVAFQMAPKSRLRIDDPPSLNITQLCLRARRVKQKHGLSLVVVDYLQLIEGPRLKGENRQEEVARISRRLKGLARELHVPVIALSQLNRVLEHRDVKRPRLADLRESGQIEQDADAVLMLHRPEMYDPEDRKGLAEIHVAKNRGGSTGMVELSFIGSQTRFEPKRGEFTQTDAQF